MTCLDTVDLSRHYPTPQHRASGFDWNRYALPTARLVGGLLLDAAIVVGALAVLLLVGSPAVDLYLQWRR